jgi:16S rRNA (cytidine1402-2'-O)-methyltransferase
MPRIAEKPGVLYVVATPIGNFEDITLRALKVLAAVDAVVCEELREGSSLLKKLGITGPELVTLNEHNEKSRIPELISRLWQGQTLALISDCGTPVFQSWIFAWTDSSLPAFYHARVICEHGN